MKRNYRSSGIILQVRASGEKNRFLNILTPKRGIIKATAYGAASPRSKLRSTTQSFYSGELLFYENPVNHFVKVVDIDVQREFSGLRWDTRKLYAASLLAELLLAVHGGSGEDSQAYRLSYEFFANLDDSEPDKIMRLVNLALWRLLEIIGEQPNPLEDVITGAPFFPNASVRYLHNEGGFTTQFKEKHAQMLQAPERIFLTKVPQRTMAENTGEALPAGADRRLFFLLCSMYEYSIGRPLKTLSAGFLPC